VNHTPGSSLGFNISRLSGLNEGVPYLIVSGYASLGNPITGPQNTYQNDYQGSYSIAMTRGRHNLKFGADLDRQQINVLLRHRHQRLLRFRSVPRQRFLRQLPAGAIGAVLPGRRRVRPRPSQVGRGRVRAG
jgi:hypothetical protein